ncbi:MAG: helix-turn-helix transcriptional regulator [Clostridia bacterium]|nr:helix-turn-helix transcriptional regulator [Clostridia bacterium]
MDYKKTILKRDFSVSDVISVHYFEYVIDFAFPGELHDFWEFVYADKNELVITANTKEFVLPQGSLFLHKPMEFHNVRGNGSCAPNSVIVSFSSDSKELFDLAGRALPCNSLEKSLMAGIIEAASEAFEGPFGDPYTAQLVRKKNPVFGSEQLVGLRLEEMMISLIRRYSDGYSSDGEEAESSKNRKDEERLRRICEYLRENLEKDLRSADIQKKFYISESSLQKLFQHKVGCGAMQHFQRMKIERAKELIREKKLNFSEISRKLSFSSIHYFSRRFKALTGMTPSEYAASVKSILSSGDEK